MSQSNTLSQRAGSPTYWQQHDNVVAAQLATGDYTGQWSKTEKVLFRFFFIYFLLQAIPLDWKFYRDLFSIDWSHLYYGDVFNIAHYTPRILPGGNSFLNHAIIAIIAIAGAAVWGYKDRAKTEYNQAYYWLRVVLRYRLAIAVIAYGFIKFYPLQSPFPSLSQLNTNYGDFTTWKMFSVSLGAAPGYEIFLGFVEILAGLLLLYRKTATIGAFIIVSFTGNVFLSNVAYEGGEYVYAAYLALIAMFLLAFDAHRLYRVLFLEQATLPNSFNPVFAGVKKIARLVAKTAFILFFVVLYGFKTYEGYKNNPHNIPTTEGLANASGLYNVSEFRINNKVLPYSATDPLRWQNVVFEKWATISIKSNRAVVPDVVKEEKVSRKNEDKLYEEEGTTGRHYYMYTIDSVHQVLNLRNNNTHYKNEQLVLHYSRPDANHIILNGTNENRDSVYVVLDRLDKKYLIIEGRRKPQKL